MAKGLETLIRLRRWRIDEQRRRLADAIRRTDELHREAHQVEREIADEQTLARAYPLEAGTAYAGFARTAIDRRARAAEAIAKTEAEIAAARDDLAESYRALRTLELAEAERRRRQALEAARREQIVLDEVALQGHRNQEHTGSPR